MNLDTNLGLIKNPFSKKSSEQELDFLQDIFFEPNYYATLMDVLSGGDSRFIIGQRGHGKTSIINNLYEDLEKKNILTIKIDRFDSIPISKNETALIKLILGCLVTKTSIFLSKNPKKVKKLEKADKEKLALFIRLFFKPISKVEYEKIYDRVKKFKTKNRLIKLFNSIGIGIANTAASAVVTITSTTIRQSLGLPEVESNETYKSYIKRLPEIDIEQIDLEKIDYPKDKLKQILDELLLIIKSVGFNGVVILFDKIDEYQNLNQDINKITNFTSEILSDTELLLNNNFAIGFSLWSELKSELSGIVRFDKFGTIDVRWKSDDLEPLINKRLSYFSKDQPVKLLDLIANENDRAEIIKVSNKSPRDLISALAEIYKVQANTNIEVHHFEPICITNGLINFCKDYDYESMTPSKKGKNKEIRAMINRLLKVRIARFTAKQLTNTFNQTTAQTTGQIKIMKQYKLIQEDDILDPEDGACYEVIDPKVEYLIRRGILSIE